MTKKELTELLTELQIAINEGTPEDVKTEASERICFWEYTWEPLIASSEEFNTNVTYQVSFLADKPRHEKLLELKERLAKKGIFPVIQHEYIVEDRRWHSFFSIEVLENV